MFSRFHSFFFYLTILLLPSQLAYHFWPEWSYVLGLRLDYLSPALYLTDILIVLTLICWLLEPNSTWKVELGVSKGSSVFVTLLLLLLFCLLSLLTSQVSTRPYLTAFKLLKLFEFFFWGVYIVKTINPFRLLVVQRLLLITLFYSSLIALVQFIKQASVGGPLWSLGERTFNIATPGIAVAQVARQEFLRPYATFPHPNALAGYFLVVLILTSPFWLLNLKKPRVFTVLSLSFIAIVLSYSQTIWILILLFLPLLFIKSKKQLIFYCIAALFLLSLFLLYAVYLSAQAGCVSFAQCLGSESLSRRLALNQAALQMIINHPFTGVGLNQFLVQLPRYWQEPQTIRFLQPVHNIYLLIAAETGIIGLGLFFLLILQTLKNLKIENWDLFGNWNLALSASLGAILAAGLLDHYWLTLQQTQLLFTLVLALAWSKQPLKTKA